MDEIRHAVLIAGPTASGKSALALRKAEETGGIVVNADSMQVYDVLRVLTARPCDEEMARVPHRLYGHVHPGEQYSTGRWLEDVRAVMAETSLNGRPLIFVGGTGLYFRALTQGLSPMPDIPAPVRERWRLRLGEEGPESLHRILKREDPAAAAAIRPGDGQRIVRALEVLEASGKPISHWQALAGKGLVDGERAERIVLMPERETLYRTIERRLDRMVEEGAMEEVEALLALDLDPAMPAMKAIGVREFAAVLGGEMTMPDALAAAKTATRQYAKRQMTWFRNQFGEGWKVQG
ncbi:tRNA (adenosine(37)-N6)-dimethylallyltransferase MiaA [Oricola thermophila]|uniref:tRNA dimethylallyltransferase n=1 Tax=Oricola thermophila TaxID=2742145 RepID=A0A6N1VDN1_9HYPH|nr:tRNA (adenosine(37)-N6)-dimethylallyltransferase MiaA [Oricola thermophila]QKV17269.1 tRNA (adenosine(37)-N6)-dimethylallyltransferase MiaA [Oricola thermophila]